MASAHVKKNDTVVVISGAAKGRTGRILNVDRKKQRVVVEGVNMRKKTMRRSQENLQGGIVEKEAPIHISNVMLKSKYDERLKKHGKEPKQAEEAAETAEAGAEEQDEVTES